MTDSDDPVPDRSLLLRTLRPVLALISADAVTCDVTAAYVWGINAYPWGTRVTRTRLHVAVPTGVRGVCRQAVTAHRERIPDADRTLVEAVRVTTPTRTACDVAARAPSLFAATARLDSFLARGLVSRAQLSRAVCGAGPRERFQRLSSALRLASEHSQSPAESHLRVLLSLAHLPTATPQCPVPTVEGTLHANLGWPEFRVALEYDSAEHHSGRGALIRDEWRYAVMRDEGWSVLSISPHDLRRRPDRLLARIAGELTARGWRCTEEQRRNVERAIRRCGRGSPHPFRGG
ncbi:hypothetical protein [Nocardiopsis lucentensis]|uniref:hypothetical protein n=1 Tax=Nocardiopsis lucentensis TaxID=53441 RepID=UPI00034D1A3D|nr:hypothetical protein [Nocardiopsis lucentensis]